MGEKIRTFVAVSMPGAVLQAIGNAQETLRAHGLNIRWVRKEGIHLTLKFLGNIDVEKVGQVQAAMEQASKAFSPFTLAGKGIGVFPNIRRARVVWAGMSGEVEALRGLQRELESQLEPVGFPKERRPFKGHLTLGRVKGRLDAAKLTEGLEALEDFQTESFTANSVVLYRSDLRPGGAVYSKLAEVALVTAER